MRKQQVFIAFLLLVLTSAPARAVDLVEDQSLSFGQFALRNNDAPHTIVMDEHGNISADPAFAFFDEGHEGIFTVTDCPANSPVGVIIDDTALTFHGLGGGAPMYIDNYTTPVGLTSDAAGSVTFSFGATLTVSGTGAVYPDGTQEAQYDVTIFC